MKNEPFWSNFEEPAIDISSALDSRLCQGTMTKQQREEPDRTMDTYLAGTMTKTATIEESDQDFQQVGYFAIPCVSYTGTRTLTETREENDQDAQSFGYSAFPEA